jgi:hypothetical protein
VRVFDDDDGGTHGTDSALGNMGAGSAIDPGNLMLAFIIYVP